jgi:hypothetical protein
LGIARSLALGKELRDSRPGWIASLAWSVRLLMVAQLLPMLLVLLDAMGEHIRSFASWQTTAYITCGVFLAATALHVVGCYLLTRPENRYAVRQPLAGRAILLRLCCLGPLIAAGIVTMLTSHYDQAMARPAEVLAGVLASGFIPCPLLQFLILRKLAFRVLDEGLAEHSAIVARGYSISLILLFLLPFLADLIRPTVGFYTVLAILTSLCLFWFWSVVLFAFAAHAFHQAARSARTAWRSADAASAAT